MALFQKISKEIPTEQELFEKYFIILSSVNSIHLPPAEIKLLAFTAIKGNISSGAYRTQFCEQEGVPMASLGNLIYKLTKKGWLIKRDGRTVINPIIKAEPSEEIILNIKLHVDKG